MINISGSKTIKHDRVVQYNVPSDKLKNNFSNAFELVLLINSSNAILWRGSISHDWYMYICFNVFIETTKIFFPKFHIRKVWCSGLHIEQTISLKYFVITANIILHKRKTRILWFMGCCMSYIAVHNSIKMERESE